jgi:putative signal transducing protein
VSLLLRTNDLVLISAVEAILSGAKIEYQVADTYTSVVEGSIGAIPRRILVATDRLKQAQQIMTDAGYGHLLSVH